MTTEEYWKKYNHCPKCRFYPIQGSLCENCKWKYGTCLTHKYLIDMFEPNEKCIREMEEVIQQ